MVVVMIIVWAVVAALALLLEFFIYNFISAWFSIGGIAALISAPAGLYWPWQILLFFSVSFAFLLALRPIAMKFIKNKTIPTNLDANVGMKTKLLKDVNNGCSEIKINDIIWTVVCTDELNTGDKVEITGMQGNKYIVKKEEKL